MSTIGAPLNTGKIPETALIKVGSMYIRPQVEFYQGTLSRTEIFQKAGEYGFKMLSSSKKLNLLHQELEESRRNHYIELAKKQHCGQLSLERTACLLEHAYIQLHYLHLYGEVYNYNSDEMNRQQSGYNAVIRQDEKLKGGETDFINLSEKSGKPTEDMISKLGMPENTKVEADRKKIHGEACIIWKFSQKGRKCETALNLLNTPTKPHKYVGAVLYKETNDDDVRNNFPQRLKIEPVFGKFMRDFGYGL